MSGRSRYRKGHHPRLGRFAKPAPARRAPHELPDWRLIITLPTQLAFAVSPGKTPVFGVSINAAGQVVAEGKDWRWVYEQAGKYLAIIGKNYDGVLPTGVLTRGEEPPFTESGPPADKPIKREQRIIVVSRASVVFLRGTREPVIVAA